MAYSFKEIFLMDINTIKQIQTARYYNWQNDVHIGFMTRIEKLVTGFFDTAHPMPPKLKPLAEAFYAAREEEDRAYLVSQKAALTARIAELDQERDEMLRQVKSMVATMAKMAKLPAMQQAAIAMQPALELYHPDPSMAYEAENTALTQWHDIYSADTTQVAAARTLGIDTIIGEMMVTTDKMIDLIVQRSHERGEVADIDLKAARLKTDAAYHAMVLVLNALAILDDDPRRYEALIIDINTAQDDFQQDSEDRRRNNRRVSVKSDIVGNRRYAVSAHWTWEKLAAANPEDFAVADGRIHSANEKALQAGGLVVALEGLPVKPTDEALTTVTYALIPKN